MISSFTATNYEDQDTSVSWLGQSFSNSDDLISFLRTKVRARLDDIEGKEDLRNHIAGLALTGMGKKSLAAMLEAENPQKPAWAGGEALAEAYLAETKSAIFPWNTERDKRNPLSLLQGSDLVGFIEDGEGFRFAFGEVKTSSEERHPPQVMSNRPGHMGHQIKRLACDLQVRFQLICWLQARIEGKLHQKAFDRSCARYFNSEQKSIALFGILVRDTQPDERDLSARGRELRRKLASPIECDLIALYLPWKMDQLMLSIYQGGNA